MDALIALGKVEKWSMLGRELGVEEELLVEFLAAA